MVLYILAFYRDSAVGIATRYGLDGPSFESRWEGDFQDPSRTAPRPNQPPVQWVPTPSSTGIQQGYSYNSTPTPPSTVPACHVTEAAFTFSLYFNFYIRI
jgi:hypothetical protein